MNPEQIKTAIGYTAAMIAGIAMAVGVMNQEQATQFTSQLATIINSSVALLGAVGGIASMVQGIWRRSHANQITAAAASIRATGDIETAAPVMNALNAVGANVDPGRMPETKADAAELPSLGVR